jgi:hypothetical protein
MDFHERKLKQARQTSTLFPSQKDSLGSLKPSAYAVGVD